MTAYASKKVVNFSNIGDAMGPVLVSASEITDATAEGIAVLTGDAEAGRSALSAVADTDIRLSDARPPTDASVTLVKLGTNVTVAKLGVVALDVCHEASTDSSVDVDVGGFIFDPADWSISGKTTDVVLKLWGRIAADGLTGLVTVYDVTAGTRVSVGSVSILSTTGAAYTISIATPVAQKAYVVALKVSGGSAPSDIVTVTGAERRITWS